MIILILFKNDIVFFNQIKKSNYTKNWLIILLFESWVCTIANASNLIVMWFFLIKFNNLDAYKMYQLFLSFIF